MPLVGSPLLRRTLLGTAAGAALGQASAQTPDYPTRPVRVIVPNPPGGSSDVIGRILAAELSTAFGQPFVVENRAGAGGNIGVETVARSTPDGYTLGVTTVTQLITNTYLYQRMAIEPMRALACVSICWENPNVLIVPTRIVPARTLPEFIAWGRAQPNGLSFCSSGVGFTSHLLGELFGLRTGIRVTHVPFRGAGEATPSMLRGEVQFSIDNLASWRGLIDRGDVTALAITDRERSPLAPEIPTMAELGMPDFTTTIFAGFIAPAGTPDAIVQAVSARLRQLSTRPDLAQRAAVAGAKLTGTTPEEMRERAERERPYWAELVRISGARLD